LGGSVHTIVTNIESFVVASKGIGLEVKADKITYTYSCLEIRVQNEVEL
jgi:hypothetical protein